MYRPLRAGSHQRDLTRDHLEGHVSLRWLRSGLFLFRASRIILTSRRRSSWTQPDLTLRGHGNMWGAEQEVVCEEDVITGSEISLGRVLSVSCSYTLVFVSQLSLRQLLGLSHYIDVLQSPLLYWMQQNTLKNSQPQTDHVFYNEFHVLVLDRVRKSEAWASLIHMLWSCASLHGFSSEIYSWIVNTDDSNLQTLSDFAEFVTLYSRFSIPLNISVSCWTLPPPEWTELGKNNTIMWKIFFPVPE